MDEKNNDINDLRDYIPDLSDGEFEKFRTYFEILEIFNNKMNLISQTTMHKAGRRHFADCYIGIKSFDSEIPAGETVYDFGSGNGFPGAIFGIMRPDLNIVLVERDRRKCEFLKHLSHQLELKNVSVFTGNAKGVGTGVARWAVSRAMSPLAKMLLMAREVMIEDSHLFLFKGEYWTGEFSAVPPQLFDFWDVSVRHTYQMANSDVGRVILDCHRLKNG